MIKPNILLYVGYMELNMLKWYWKYRWDANNVQLLIWPLNGLNFEWISFSMKWVPFSFGNGHI